MAMAAVKRNLICDKAILYCTQPDTPYLSTAPDDMRVCSSRNSTTVTLCWLSWEDKVSGKNSVSKLRCINHSQHSLSVAC